MRGNVTNENRSKNKRKKEIKLMACFLSCACEEERIIRENEKCGKH